MAEVDEGIAGVSLGEVFTSEKNGSDEAGDGTETNPLKTILAAMKRFGKDESFPVIYVDAKAEDKRWEVAAKTQIKKQLKLYQKDRRKEADAEAAAKKEDEDALRREKNLEDAKKIVIHLDTSLPEATQIKVRAAKEYREKRIKVYGWVHRLRRQGGTTLANISASSIVITSFFIDLRLCLV